MTSRPPKGAPRKTREPAPDLARLKRLFEEARDLTADSRLEALTDIDYYDSKQWTAEELAALRERRQPDIVINRIKPAINGIVGVVERGRSEPRAFPRSPRDDDSADIATDVLRFIADFNRFHRLKQECFLDMLTPGTMAALVGVDGDSQVEIMQVRWEEFFADPRSRRRDFKDARYLGVAKWMYCDDVIDLYPDRRTEIEASVDGAALAGDVTFQDRPFAAGQAWSDRRQRRLLVVELYYREGGAWMRCVFHGGGVLEAGASPYLDQKGRPDCPIEAQSAFVDRDNNRYGVVRDMRGPQDEINKRRSKLLHLLSVSQIEVADPSAIDVSADAARAEAARPDGVIPYGWRKVSTADMAAGQSALLQEAKAEIERMGPNPAILGREGLDQSGRALLARQQAGLSELALLFGALEDWELRVYRQCWARARQFWRAPQFIRVTDDRDAPKFVHLNAPIAQPAGKGSRSGVLGYRNAIAEMDVDIILETTPDVGTLRQEQFASLTQLVGANPAWAAQVPFEVMLELSAVPDKRQISDRLKQAREAAEQGEGAARAQAQQVAMATAAAAIEKTRSEASLNEARAQVELFHTLVNAHEAGKRSEEGPGVEPTPWNRNDIQEPV